MSSYWAAYYGDGLVLKSNEFDAFLDAYAKDKGKENLDKEIEEEELREYPFKCSNGDGEFYVVDITDDDTDGSYFIPFMYEGKLNTSKYQGGNGVFGISMRSETPLYVIFSDKQLGGPESFEKRPYNSYDEFVQEFKDKIGSYLPDNFDWDSHLGNFSYAQYA